MPCPRQAPKGSFHMRAAGGAGKDGILLIQQDQREMMEAVPSQLKKDKDSLHHKTVDPARDPQLGPQFPALFLSSFLTRNSKPKMGA